MIKLFRKNENKQMCDNGPDGTTTAFHRTKWNVPEKSGLLEKILSLEFSKYI